MKKKVIIVSIVVLILLILLIPRPRYLNDGGTVEYKALLYQTEVLLCYGCSIRCCFYF